MNPAELNLNPMSQIDIVVIVAIAVVFVATYFVLRKVFVLPYLAVMERRELLFDVADDQARQADEIMRQADLDAEMALSNAAQTAEQLRMEARERGETYRRERVDEASKAASERLERGRGDIAAARESEVAQLREQAVDCVSVACGQLLGEPDVDAIEAAVDRLMARRVH